jgi:hypothetical protein
VRGAVVSVGEHSARTAQDGVAEILVPRLRPLLVTIRAQVITNQTIKEQF